MPNYDTANDYWNGQWNGDKPYVKNGFQPADTVKVFKKVDTGQHLDPLSIRAGYGILPEGTLMAEIAYPVKGQPIHVPYAKAVPVVGDTEDYGKILLAKDGDGTTGIYVSLRDSYCFVVGDKIRAVDSDTTAVDLGAITAIDRATYLSANQAKITVTNVCPNTITMTNGACISIQTKTSASFTKAIGLLFGGSNTGLGADAQGGDGDIIVSGVTVYVAAIPNLDDPAVVDMGAFKQQANRLLILR